MHTKKWLFGRIQYVDWVKKVMGEQKETRKFVCWINEEEKILSFHYEEGYIRKEFEDKEDFRFFILAISRRYKVQ